MASIHYLQKPLLSDEDMVGINTLELQSKINEGINYKLELDYKAQLARLNRYRESELAFNDEFLAYDDQRLVGYLGMIRAKGRSSEITGLVDPAYRNKGIFTRLYKEALASLNLSNTAEAEVHLPLLICDRNSPSGQTWTQKRGQYHHTEYEMFLDYQNRKQYRNPEIALRRANREDSIEINRQNAEYFNMPFEQLPLMDPEALVLEGMHIYMAYLQQSPEFPIGKVHLQLLEGQGAIYGLGIKHPNRGHGYGRQLLHLSVAQLISMQAESILLQVEVENDNALALYLSSGFKTTATMDYYTTKISSV